MVIFLVCLDSWSGWRRIRYTPLDGLLLKIELMFSRCHPWENEDNLMLFTTSPRTLIRSTIGFEYSESKVYNMVSSCDFLMGLG